MCKWPGYKPALKYYVLPCGDIMQYLSLKEANLSHTSRSHPANSQEHPPWGMCHTFLLQENEAKVG